MAIALIAQGRFNEPPLSSFCKFSVLPRAEFYALSKARARNEFSVVRRSLSEGGNYKNSGTVTKQIGGRPATPK
jgi:hypothetical protein